MGLCCCKRRSSSLDIDDSHLISKKDICQLEKRTSNLIRKSFSENDLQGCLMEENLSEVGWLYLRSMGKGRSRDDIDILKLHIRRPSS